MLICVIRRDRHVKNENWKREQNTVKCELDLNNFWKSIGMTGVHQDRQLKIPLKCVIKMEIPQLMIKVPNRCKEDSSMVLSHLLKC